MTGIYKITNLINQHCYVGQSKNIQSRWKNHRTASHNPNDKGYEYPLYRAIRKYGIDNFSFEILEECSIESLNDKECYWINYYNPEYNQATGGNYTSISQKLTYEQVQEIQQILINDKEGVISHQELADKYNVSAKDTIRDINVGRTWYNPNYTYPLHTSKYDPRKTVCKIFCKQCGQEISRQNQSGLCVNCYNRNRKEDCSNLPLSREELKNAIRNYPFTKIAEQFNVSDNAIRKWCDKYNLPRKKIEIKNYSDEEWNLI